MDLTNAPQSLMALFVEHISTLSADITSVLKSKVTEWIASQALFIQALFGNVLLFFFTPSPSTAPQLSAFQPHDRPQAEPPRRSR